MPKNYRLYSNTSAPTATGRRPGKRSRNNTELEGERSLFNHRGGEVKGVKITSHNLLSSVVK
jgi:hypothetical protein